MARRSGSRFATAGVRRNNFEICKPKRAGGHEQHRGSGLVPLLSPSRIRTERDIEHAAGLRISPVSRPQIRRPCPSSRFPRRWACRNRRASPQALVPSAIDHCDIALRGHTEQPSKRSRYYSTVLVIWSTSRRNPSIRRTGQSFRPPEARVCFFLPDGAA